MSLIFCNPHDFIKQIGKTLILIVLIWPVMTNCAQENKNRNDTSSRSNFGIDYDLMNPDKIMRLPHELEEISGLSYFRDSIVVAVQDERGKLYFYDYNKQKLLDDFSFGNDGDYEGVELVDKMIYAVKSNGVIYIIDVNTKEIKSVKTRLKTRNNVEGLAYDAEKNQLILACKGSPSLSKQDKKGRSFYAYNLNKQQLIKKPLFNVTKKEIASFLGKRYEKKINEFKPSGVAVHPITGHVYILAHGGKWLLKLNRSYDIIGVSSLKSKLFRQPEGICFAPNGDLLISNEGDGGRGTLLYYKYPNHK